MLLWKSDAVGAAISRPYDETDGASLERVIGQMKRWVSRQAGFPMWQKSYYDHVVRSEKDYLEIWNYIDGNPSNWEEDCAQLRQIPAAEQA